MVDQSAAVAAAACRDGHPLADLARTRILAAGEPTTGGAHPALLDAVCEAALDHAGLVECRCWLPLEASSGAVAVTMARPQIVSVVTGAPGRTCADVSPSAAEVVDAYPRRMTVEAIAALREPVRRAVYDHVVAAPSAVSRNDVAEAVGIGRTLAAHHLDRLVEAGLLETSSARLNGRTGPGAGRPAKLYRRAPGEVAVSLPPREYRLLAEILAQAADNTGIEPAVYDAARRRGEGVARPGEEPEAAARRLGYEPYRDGDVIRLRNCPFHAVTRGHEGLVCGANLAFLSAAVGAGARLDPDPEGCCVVFDASPSSKNNSH
jgi:predicted ArsR family transcriptional regulator